MNRPPQSPFRLPLAPVLSLLAGLALTGLAVFTWGGPATPAPPARDLPTCGYAQRGALLVYTFTGPFLAPGSGLTIYATYDGLSRDSEGFPTPRLLVWWPTVPESPEGPRGLILSAVKTLHGERPITKEIQQIETRYGTTWPRDRDQ